MKILLLPALKYVFPIVFLFTLPFSGIAEEAYITDQLIISLKSSPEQPNRQVGVVRSNQLVTILERQDIFAQIQTSTGDIGWLKHRYLTENKPKTEVIDKLNSDLSKCLLSKSTEPSISVIKEPQTVITEQVTYNGTKMTALQAFNELSEDYNQLQEGSQDVSELLKQRDQMALSVVESAKSIGQLEGELQALKKRNSLYLIFAGGLVFLFGLLFGRFFVKRKSRYAY